MRPIAAPALALATLMTTATAHAQPAPFTLTSSTFADDAKIPAAQAYNKDGCGGQNVSPALAWSGVPTGTKSLAIVMHDPDAGKGKGYTHWVTYGIAPAHPALAAGSGGVGDGLTPGKSGFGVPGYGGPCPPVGEPPHHYVFTLYAIDLLPAALKSGLDRDALLTAIRGHAIGTATLTGLYQRTSK